MTAAIMMALLLAQAMPPGLDQIRADPNLEHRAKAAIEFAAAAERRAETAYTAGNMTAVAAELKSMVQGVETANEALQQTGRSAMRHPGPYKSGELKTEEILVRLGDLEHKMDADERSVITGPRAKVQEIHDDWFDGIMSRKKK
jgi:hypothetical protein